MASEINLLQFYDFRFETLVELSRFEQRQKHRRSRINKKWRKRYGFINERFTMPLDGFKPKFWKKYQKQFIVRGEAIPNRSQVRQVVLNQPPISVLSMDRLPTESVSYDTEVFELRKAAMYLHIPFPEVAKEAAGYIKQRLVDAVSKQTAVPQYSDEIIGDILESEFLY